MCKPTELILNTGNIGLKFTSLTNGLYFDIKNSVHNFISPKTNHFLYRLNFSLSENLNCHTSDWIIVFSGNPEENSFLNYSWEIYKREKEYMFVVLYKDHPHIESIQAFLKKDQSNIDIYIKPRLNIKRDISEVTIDPLIHPLGSLLLIYLFLWNRGLLIHGSAVNYNNNTYLFTGVSGIGKSTMARLWKEYGADIINDDRLILKPGDKEVMVYNSPMPHYAQQSKEGTLKGIFLLKQEKYNYIKPVNGIEAFARVLGNCIQQFYSSDMIKTHLSILESIVCSVPVYEVGFLPTKDIVLNILEYMGNEG